MISPKYAGKFLFPQALGLVKSRAQGFKDNLICCFHLVVCLRVLDRSYEEFFVGLSLELGAVVSDNGIGRIVSAYEVFPGKLCYLAG